MSWSLELVAQRGVAPIIHTKTDDTIAEQHKDTRHLDSVDWHSDQAERQRTRGCSTSGLLHLC